MGLGSMFKSVGKTFSKAAKSISKSISKVFKIPTPKIPELPAPTPMAPTPMAANPMDAVDNTAPTLELGGQEEGALRKRKKKGRARLRISPEMGGSGLSAGRTGLNVPLK